MCFPLVDSNFAQRTPCNYTTKLWYNENAGRNKLHLISSNYLEDNLVFCCKKSTNKFPNVLDLMEKNINEQSGNGIYLHCQRGEDRTGLMIALLRECQESSWKSEFIDYGGVMYKPLLKLMMDVDKVRNARKL